MICSTSAHGISTAGPRRAVSLPGSPGSKMRRVGAGSELAPGERDHRQAARTTPITKKMACVCQRNPRSMASRPAAKAHAIAPGRPVAFFVAARVGQHTIMLYLAAGHVGHGPREGSYRGNGGGPRHATACTSRGSRTRQVTYPICARICARDAAGRIETGEMPTLDTDAAPPVDRGQFDDWRRSETPGTHVVWVITQRRFATPRCAVRPVETGQRRITEGPAPCLRTR